MPYNDLKTAKDRLTPKRTVKGIFGKRVSSKGSILRKALETKKGRLEVA